MIKKVIYLTILGGEFMSDIPVSSIKRSTSTRTKTKKVNQIPFGILLIAVMVAVGFYINIIAHKSVVMWIFGIACGFILQRSRFCFTASLRDPVLTGSTSLTKAVIIAIAVATVGFASLQFSAVSKGLAIPGNISPAGIHVAIGATLFGIGMVIAGGCASGTLMRVGEGFTMQMISLVFFIIGSVWGAHDFGWWSKIFISKTKPIFLPSVLGWFLSLVLQFGLLFVLYVVADKFGNRKKTEQQNG